MIKNYYYITLALAGICQSAYLTQKLAYEGQCDSKSLRTSLNSVLDLNPSSTLSVYGNDETHLRFGLHSLLAMLNIPNHQSASAELMRYTLNLMVLERKLNANKFAINTLAKRITQLDRQLTYYDIESETIVSAIAGIYVDVISPLGPRIRVTGLPSLLQNSQIQSKIRASLLAGIRSAVLWKQNGGGRLQLMFFRNRLTNEAKHILSSIPSP